MNRGFILAIVLACALSGCKPGPENLPVKVWADPALKTALEELAPSFRKHHPGGWEIEYRESSDIAKLTGANKPDVVLTVEPVAQELRKGGQIDEGTLRTFAGDLLTVVTPRSEPQGLAKLGDLVMTHFNFIGVGTLNTSVGYYAHQALVSDGAEARIKDKVKTYGSIDELAATVEAGTVDFGIIYASSAAQHKDLAVATTVPEDLYEDIRYTAAATKQAAGNQGVLELLKLLAEDEATQKLFGSYGYLDRLTAMEERK